MNDNEMLLKAQDLLRQEQEVVAKLEQAIAKGEQQLAKMRADLIFRRGTVAALTEVQTDRVKPTVVKPEPEVR